MATNPKSMLCVRCGTLAVPATYKPGYFVLEAAMWVTGAFFFWPLLVAGICYSLWRFCTQRPACQVCGGKELLPGHSPKAEAIRSSMGKAKGQTATDWSDR